MQPLSGVMVLCSWAGRFTLTVPLPTQEYNLWDWLFARETWVNIGCGKGGGGVISNELAPHLQREVFDVCCGKIVLGSAHLCSINGNLFMDNIQYCIDVLSTFTLSVVL